MSVHSFNSPRHDGALFCGKQSAVGTFSDFVPFREVMTMLGKQELLPTPPQMFGHGHSYGQGEWKMLGNGPDDSVFKGFQGAGDCAEAGPYHAEMEAAKASGRKLAPFTGKTVIGCYSTLTGYDPHTGRNDNGTNVQEVLKFRQEQGLPYDDGSRAKIGQVCALEPGNVHELWVAAWLFENVEMGQVLCEAQEQQFAAKLQPTWDFVPGSPEVGGHLTPVVGKLGLISWAEDVYYTPRYIEKQMDEGYCYIDNLRYSAVTGETTEHWADQDLEKFIVMLAQHKFAAASGDRS